MSKGSSADSYDEEFLIEVDDDQHHSCCRGVALSTTVTTSNGTVLSLQAMVDAVVDCCDPTANSPSAMSSRSVACRASSSTSSPRCSPSLCRYSDDAKPRSVMSPAARRSNSDESFCGCDVRRHQKLQPAVALRLPSAVSADRRHRPSFLIEEILRPDFGCRRPPTTLQSPPAKLPNSKPRQFPAELIGVNHVTTIWQPFAASPSGSAVDASELSPRVVTTSIGCNRKKKSVNRKSRDADVD